MSFAYAAVSISVVASIWLLVLLPRRARLERLPKPADWGGPMERMACSGAGVHALRIREIDFSILVVFAGCSGAGGCTRRSCGDMAVACRSVRHGGLRSVTFPYRTMGVVLIVSAVVVPIAGASLVPGRGSGWPRLFRARLRVVMLGMRGAQPATVQIDPRPPVLFLRSFREEEEMFAEVLRRQNQFYTHSERTSFLLDPRFPTFEDYFYEDLNRTLGSAGGAGEPGGFRSA